MSLKRQFFPHHLHAEPSDFEGNNGVGRYILLPGSNGRAKAMALHLQELVMHTHPRGHDFYLGKLVQGQMAIDVGIISSGMGCSSMEIILHELLALGARRFLRVGTAGSLQAQQVKIGHYINVQASVRDEKTTEDYAPLGYPAVASLAWINAINAAALQLNLTLHTGIVHCKSSFYAKEFGVGPKHQENENYMHALNACGVLASEMETATLFVQSHVYEHDLLEKQAVLHPILSGAVLQIVSSPAEKKWLEDKNMTEELITLAFASVAQLAMTEIKN